MANSDLRQRLLAHERLIGVFYNLDSIDLIEIVAAADYDFVVIDQEHSTISGPLLTSMIRIASTNGLGAFVRVPDQDPKRILQACDAGADGILCPEIHTADDAARLVAAGRYPPTGIRGVHPATRASGWGRCVLVDHVRQQDEGICLIAQIESVAGLRNIDEIVAVSGLDAVLVGPRDLAFSAKTITPGAEQAADTAASEVWLEQSIVSVIDAAHRQGITCGSAVYTDRPPITWERAGASLFIGGIAGLINRGLDAQARALRNQEGTEQ